MTRRECDPREVDRDIDLPSAAFCASPRRRAERFHAEVEVNPQERNPFYMRFTDLYVQWTKNARFAVTVGKHAVPFTNEGATSSKELLTIDRSMIGQNIWFPQEYMPGVSVSGRVAPWNYRFGFYSSGAMNRVASAVGEGSMVVRFVHEYLSLT